MKIKDSVTRRKLLQSTSSALLLYPLLRVFQMDEAIGATAVLPRALFVHWPTGCYLNQFWPAGGSGPIGALPVVSAPLEAHKNDIILFKGLCTRGDTNHNGAPAQVFAGWGKQGGGIMPCEGSTAQPYSLDQMLADKWGDKTLKKMVGLGAFTSSPASRQTVSYKNGGAPEALQDNPKAAYNDLFGSFSYNGVGSTGLALAQDNVLSGKKRVIDYLRGDLKKIKTTLGPLEGAMYESHVSVLDDLAKDIQRQEDLQNQMNGGGNAGGNSNGGDTSGGSNGMPSRLAACSPKGIPNGFPSDSGAWHTDTKYIQTIFKLNRQIMVQALACGLTRVGLLQFGNSDCEVDWGTGRYHTNSHAGGSAYATEQALFMTEVANLFNDLKAVKIGDHSLFDETLTLAATDLGDDPNGHDGVNVAAFFAGSLGGKIKTGRMISYPFTPRDWTTPTNGMTWNRMLLTFASLVGEPGITEIGSTAPSYKGILPEV